MATAQPKASNISRSDATSRLSQGSSKAELLLDEEMLWLEELLEDDEEYSSDGDGDGSGIANLFSYS